MEQQLLSDRIEQTILSNLFFNEDFTRKALPFINQNILVIQMKEYYMVR